MKTQFLYLQAKTQKIVSLSLLDQSEVLFSLFTFSQAKTQNFPKLFRIFNFPVKSQFTFYQAPI
jgi:hypothetical protein